MRFLLIVRQNIRQEFFFFGLFWGGEGFFDRERERERKQFCSLRFCYEMKERVRRDISKQASGNERGRERERESKGKAKQRGGTHRRKDERKKNRSDNYTLSIKRETKKKKTTSSPCPLQPHHRRYPSLLLSPSLAPPRSRRSRSPARPRGTLSS